MIINEDKRLSAKYKGFQRSPASITEITLHGTGSLKGENYNGLISWMTSETCERIPFFLKGIGLFPYEIDTDGIIHNIMSDIDWYFHSEAGTYDSHTIGIELINISKTGQRDNSGTYTDKQYSALVDLIIHLKKKYETIVTITSHDHNRFYFSNLKSKPCPGKNFDWIKLSEDLDMVKLSNKLISGDVIKL